MEKVLVLHLTATSQKWDRLSRYYSLFCQLILYYKLSIPEKPFTFVAIENIPAVLRQNKNNMLKNSAKKNTNTAYHLNTYSICTHLPFSHLVKIHYVYIAIYSATRLAMYVLEFPHKYTFLLNAYAFSFIFL